MTILVAGLMGCGFARSEAADTEKGVANWFELVAQAERLAEEEAARQQEPAPAAAPAPVAPPREGQRPPQMVAPVPAADLNALRGLIEKRNRLVNEDVLDAVKQLAAGGRAERWQIQALTDWFAIYFKMRAFMPTSRRDPNLGPVTDILKEAIGRRHDFVEGRILIATCHLYAGRPNDARAQLEQASDFLDAQSLKPSPFGLDWCGGWLRLGEPDKIAKFMANLKNPRIVPESRLTAVQSMLVAVHAWQMFRYSEAKDYFEKALRRARAFDEAPVGPGVQGLLADAALFYLVAGSHLARNGARGESLLARIPETNQAWSVRRARAALNASKAAVPDAGDASALWDVAVRELEACREGSLPTLDAEIDEQLAKYRARELWFRERPKARAK